ncbi:hypothetical protein FRC08_004004 [Ceratobasidium sp. 394]|nr:hypothetical protein FRC08_004004 [Ceratobasidium sp. 394]
MKCSFALVALFAGHVVAVNLPLCDYVCAVAAAKRIGCGPALSKACMCDSSDFNDAATSCITDKCNTSDQQAALEYKNELCSAQFWRWGSVSAIVHSFMLSLPPLYKPFPE